MSDTPTNATDNMSTPDTAPPPLAFSFPLKTPHNISTPAEATNVDTQAIQPTPVTSEGILPCMKSPQSSSLSSDMSTNVPLPKTPAIPRMPSAQHKQMRKFARSADKRQSVHMLGSIQHLQRHFMQFGLTAEDGGDTDGHQRPDIGSFAVSSMSGPSKLANTSENNPNIGIAVPPATVAKPPFPLEIPKVDLVKLRQEAFNALRALEESWFIDATEEHPQATRPPRNQEPGKEEDEPTINILDLLKTTVDAVRAVRAWSLAVPATSLVRSQTRPNDLIRTSNIPAKPRIPTISTPSRPAPNPGSRSVSGSSVRLAAKNDDGEIMLGAAREEKDPLSDLRKAALDVLACLRGVEEKFRSNDDDSADNSFEDPHEEDTRISSTSTSPKCHHSQSSPLKESTSSVPPRVEPSPIPSKRIEDSEDLWFFSQRADDASPSGEWTEEEEKKRSWYDRLASGEAGWTYRHDVRLGTDLQEEQEVVKRYLGTVVETFFGSAEGVNEVPWRTMTASEDDTDLQTHARGSEQEERDKPDLQRSSRGEILRLPEWSDSQLWDDRRSDRIRAFLEDHLSSNILGSLPAAETEDERIKMLSRLSDGYLLTLAFNTVLRHSTTGSWGFIPDEDVYDTLDSSTANADPSYGEGETSARRQKDWTFRKAGNLRCWGAALKLRYSIPLTFPIQAVDLQLVIPVIQTAETGTRSLTASRQPSASPSRRASEQTAGKTACTESQETTGGASIPFDPIRVARREAGWDGMLEAVVVAWIDKVSLELLSVAK